MATIGIKKITIGTKFCDKYDDEFMKIFQMEIENVNVRLFFLNFTYSLVMNA